MHRLGCSWQLTHVDLRWFMMVLHCVSTWFNAFQHGFTLPCSGRQWRTLSYTCLDALGYDAVPKSFTKWYAISSRSILNFDLMSEHSIKITNYLKILVFKCSG